MQEENRNLDEWPPELDALVAARRHHRLLFENDRVRVIDTLIPPGETTNTHTHQWPATLYIISWSDFIRYDAERNIVADSRLFSQTPRPASATWSGPLKPHALQNIGERPIHIISVEIKT